MKHDERSHTCERYHSQYNLEEVFESVNRVHLDSVVKVIAFLSQINRKANQVPDTDKSPIINNENVWKIRVKVN